jgi:two-component system OmpR family response regulator
METVLKIPEPKMARAASQNQKLSAPIFIVDDDNLYCHSLAFYLKTHTDHEIYCYPTGEDCLAHLDLKPEIIILDYYLGSTEPGVMDGIEVLKKIKIIKPEIKVIMLSGQETLSVASESMNLGAYTYVIKDIQTLGTLIGIIAEIDGDPSPRVLHWHR